MFGRLRRKQKTEESVQKTGAAWKRALGGIFRRSGIDDGFWEELEEALIVSDVGVKTSLELVAELRELVDKNGWKEPGQVRQALHDRIVETFASLAEEDPLPDKTKTVLLVVGVNGAGKTTSIAKIAQSAKSEGRSVLLAAADTFRAGAIEQLKIWGDRVGVPVIAQSAGGDPGAVTFDAISAAKARGADLVIVDTAGRLHTKHNLMEELKKVRGIIDREGEGFLTRVLLVIDGNTGQNGMAQAKAFTEAVHCDGVMLTKLDSTAKGGIALAIAGELGLPVWFAGTGEKVGDLSEFDPAAFADTILPESIAS
ncbi:MAG: signal recognition particle-docking protein FtsY [Chloroflexi bacterium]|nr:signal recognition particle-docking protein FtsY [Chloroflexota bacterium]